MAYAQATLAGTCMEAYGQLRRRFLRRQALISSRTTAHSYPLQRSISEPQTSAFVMELQAAAEAAGTVLVKVELKEKHGKLLSDNSYGLAANKPDYLRMNEIPAATITATAKILKQDGSERHAILTLVNSGTGAAIATKLTLMDATTGSSIMPAYSSDNYVSLLPGKTKSIDVGSPLSSAAPTMKFDLRRWNVMPASVALVR